MQKLCFQIGFAFLCFIPTTTWAASFNCAHAATAHEHHICDTQPLSAADSAMGDAYRVAASAFPVKGAVLAMQRRFLAFYDLCDKPYEMTCAAALKEQIDKLLSMVNAAVYTDTAPGATWNPDTALLWASLGGDQVVMHYFGGFMTDIYRPTQFPQGFVCDDVVTLTRTVNGYESHANGDDITLTERGISAKISCSPRNGIRGSFSRVR